MPASKDNGSEKAERQEAESKEEKEGLNNSDNVMEMLGKIYDIALNGASGIAETVDKLADDYEKRYKNDPKRAAEELARNQIIKCGSVGFVTSLGGLITLPVAVPADVASVTLIQLRMVAAIARLGGYDVHSDQVRTLCFACLVKGGVADVLKNAGIQVGKGLLNSAIKKLGFTLVTRFGYSSFGKGAVVNLGKMVPVIGGFIGGGVDIAFTRAVAHRAIQLFIDQEIPDMPTDSGDD